MVPPEPVILGFDTSAAHCAAALLCGDRVLAERFEPMARGQAERLMPLIEAVMSGAGLPLAALDAIAVGVGPGNFTGIRIGVAAARGLALALGIPAIGVTSFEAMRRARTVADGVRSAHSRQLVCLAGPRDGYLLQLFDGGRPAGPPRAVPDPDRVDWSDLGVTAETEILGHDAERLSKRHPAFRASEVPPRSLSALPDRDLAGIIARLAGTKLADGGDIPRPSPVYARPADAAPSREAGPVILPC